MAYQIVAVNDASPGACVDVGLTWNGSDTLTSTEAISGTSLTLSSTLTGGVDTDIALNTDKFTVDAGSGNTLIAGTLAAGGSITLGAGADLIGSGTSDITINTDKFTVAGDTGNTVIAGTCSIAGVLTMTEAVGFGATIEASAHGAYAIPIDEMVTNVSTNFTADLDATLADGEAGQLKVVILDTDGGNDVVITPDNFGNGTTLTLDTASDYAVFAFDGTEWWAISHSGTIA